MHFREDGMLTYVVHLEDRDQLMNLVYEAGDGVVVTDQPSHPGVRETAYHVSGDGILTLNYDGEVTTFVRAGDREMSPEGQEVSATIAKRR
jgi:hypothetical protein